MIIPLQAQYMIIGKDSISLQDFEKEYAYGLQNNGVENTIKTTQDFYLLQQFAKSKSIDTTTEFRYTLSQREAELRKTYFFPKAVVDPVLQDFINESKTEYAVQFFTVQKQAGDKTDYQQIYQDVKSGKITMDQAITTYTKTGSKPIYLKPGFIDNALFSEIKNLLDGGYTTLVDTPSFVGFGKKLSTRPSLGYLIFATLAYPDDEKATEMKNKIYADLQAGKKFDIVAKTYGTTDNEKNNGGIVLGSPTLPEEIYTAVKNLKKNQYSQPILMDGKYYVFYIYQIYPYTNDDANRNFFLNEIQNNSYYQNLEDQLVSMLKNSSDYKEFPIAEKIRKSFAMLYQYPKAEEVVFQYKNDKTTVADLRKIVDTQKEGATKLTAQQWENAFLDIQSNQIIQAYSKAFVNQPEIKKQLDETKRTLYSDYVFSKYLITEIDKHPDWLQQEYYAHKSSYFWEKRAKGRVAIIADPALVKDIKSEIKDPKNWEKLNAKYYGKLNSQNQILVHFETGDMSENADVFTKYKVPFEKGVYTTKMEQRELVIAIDEIMPPTQMTFEEAKELLKDAVTNTKLNEVIANQKANTKITIDPAFLSALEKKFKK